MPTIEYNPGTGEPPVVSDGGDAGDFARPVGAPTVWDPLVVEIEGADGSFHVADWLGPGLEVSQAVNELPSARVPVILADGWLVNLGTASNPILVPVEEALPDDRMVVVRTARPTPEQDVTLFRGFVQRVQYTSSPYKAITLDCESVAGDLAYDVQRALRGQLWLSRQYESGLGSGDETPPRIVAAEEMVFNPDGHKNCRKPLARLTPPEGEPEGYPGEPAGPAGWYVPLWASRYHADRQHWTWARVFLVLLYWLRRKPDGRLGAWPRGIIDCNLRAKILNNGWHLVDPETLGATPPADPWGRALLGKPYGHSGDGLDWWAGLKWTCARCGLGYTVETWTDGEGQPREGLRFWLAGATRVVSLALASKHFRTDDKSWTQVQASNQVSAIALTRNYGACVNEAKGAGSGLKYEITAELAPGWKYLPGRSPQVDYNPSDAAGIAAGIGQIGGDIWNKRYSRSGVEHLDHWDVLRLWVLADYADLSAGSFELVRAWAPWTAAKYAPVELADYRLGELGGLAAVHAVRPRPLGRCLTGQTPEQPWAQLVQVSYQSGTAGTWFWLAAGAAVLRNRLGLYLEIDDLGAGELADADGMTFAEAYLRGTLRLRITGTIEGDDAADTDTWSTEDSLSRRRRGKLLNLPRVFRQELREDRGGFEAGNSQFRESTHPKLEHFDAQRHLTVGRYLARADRVRVSGTLELPGLVFAGFHGSEVQGFRAGDEVMGIYAEDGQHAHDLSLRTRRTDDYALLARITWRYAPGDGKTQSPQLSTQLSLEDAASDVKFDEQQAFAWTPKRGGG